MRPQNIITVDWEDWFHICEVDHLLPRQKWDHYPSVLPEATARLLDFFSRHDISATFFILGYCAQRFPELVKDIVEAGHEIAYHTQDHNLVYDLAPQSFRQDISQGKQFLEDLTGQRITGFRAPQWSLNEKCPWGIEILQEEGYSYDASHTPLPIIGEPSYPETVHQLKTGQGSIYEFPPLILNILGLQVPAGGGWGLKTWPMSVIKRKMQRLNNNGSPATFFIHPVDVIQHKTPVPLPLIKRLVTRFGLRDTCSALESVLKQSDLISIRIFMENAA